MSNLTQATIPAALKQAEGLYHAGKLAESREIFEKILSIAPAESGALYFLAWIANRQGDSAGALALLDRANAARPNDPQILNDLGSLHLAAKRTERAIAIFNAAIAVQRDYAAAWCNLSVAHRLNHDADRAILAGKTAVQLQPVFPEAYVNLANALRDAARNDEAIDAYRMAISQNQADAEAWNNLGNALLDRDSVDEAIGAYQKAVSLRPTFASFLTNLAAALQRKGEMRAATEACRRAIELRPDDPQAYSELAIILRNSGEVDRAIAAHLRGLHDNPNDHEMHGGMLFTLLCHAGMTPHAVFEEHLTWADRHATGRIDPKQAAHFLERKDGDPDRPLRIGYVSPDFRAHAVSFFFEPLLRSHDPARVRTFCYSDVRSPDHRTERLKSAAHHWREIVGLSDDQVEQIIREDRIDILVDLAGHTSGNRLLLFARKPAPIQVTYLGYPATTGMEAIDYRFTDAIADPVGKNDKFHTETLVQLPNTFACYDPPADACDLTTLPALDSGRFTYGAFSRLAKIGPAVLNIWATILAQTPESKLVIVANGLSDPSIREKIFSSFDSRSIERSRLTLLPRLAWPDYLRWHQQIDLMLDTFPLNGHTTTCHALWMGVPVVTLAGQTHCQRMGASILSSLGLQQFIASTVEQYVRIAVRHAENPAELSRLRSTLRQRMAHSPLTDAKAHAANVESAYRQMWTHWRQTAGVVRSRGQDKPAAAYDRSPRLFNHFMKIGRPVEAQEALRKILDADTPPAVLHRAGALAQRHSMHELAADILTQCARIDPANAPVQVDLGNALLSTNRRPQAIEAYQKAIDLRSEYAVAYNNLGAALELDYRAPEAIAACRKAVQLDPHDASAHNALANALKCCARIDESLAEYRESLLLSPNAITTYCNLAYNIYFRSEENPLRVLEELTAAYRQFVQPRAGAIAPHANSLEPDRKLRIGYVSPNFREHCQTFFTMPLLSHHDHSQFEIFCYSQHPRSDELTARIRGFADVWRHTTMMSDAQLARQIRQDRIDILVDLTMNMAFGRPLLFAQRPAPIQISWLAYPGTTGWDSMDYRLTDPFLDPPPSAGSERPEHDGDYSERSIRLPETFWCYDPLAVEPAVNPLPAMESRTITFGCLNNFCKVNDPTMEMWARVMREVVGSRLILLAPPGEPRQRLLDKLGVDPNRVEFVPFLGRADYLRTYLRIDIGLDTFPYNGHTTTLDAMWMGVPVVSRCGRLAVARAGLSQASNLGLAGELVADSADGFVRLAVGLAADLSRLNRMRQTLRDSMQNSPLMDGRRFAKNVEAVYRQVWTHFCRKGPNEFAPTARLDAAAGSSETAAELIRLAHEYQKAGRFAEADAAFMRSVEAGPRNARVLNDRGVTLQELGRAREAIQCFQKAIELDPHASAFHSNLAYSLKFAGRPTDAIATCRALIEREPNLAEAHNHLGLALQDVGEFEQAVEAFGKAIALRPDLPGIFSNLAHLLTDAGKTEQAIDAAREAICRQPNLAEAHNNLGIALQQSGQIESAIDSYRQAVRCKSDFADAHSNLLYAMHFAEGNDPAEIFAEHLRWNQQHAEPLKSEIPRHANDRDPRRPLRVGYVSGDFHAHSVAFFFENILAHHRPSEVESFCYYNNTRRDSVTDRLAAASRHWRDIARLTDARAAQMIRDDRIDILVDMAGHTANNRLLVFARKPAPIQITYLGYPGTTGMSAMDFRLTDEIADPIVAGNSLHSEQLIRFSKCFLCYRPWPGAPAAGPTPAIKNGFVTFGSFNNSAKITSTAIRAWSAILREAPGSRLIIKSHSGLEDPYTRKRLIDRFGNSGIPADRLDMRGRIASGKEHLEQYHDIDIALDTWPYNGTTTTCEALWMGTPVITLMGNAHAGRVGASILQTIGLTPFIAADERQYIRMAVELAQELPRLIDVRSRIHTSMASSPLLDAKSFASNLESTYRQIWIEWCAL